jgi:hypothetical protein
MHWEQVMIGLRSVRLSQSAGLPLPSHNSSVVGGKMIEEGFEIT